MSTREQRIAVLSEVSDLSIRDLKSGIYFVEITTCWNVGGKG
jgi:hypothetical protein